MGFLGELDKIVPVSPMRFQSIGMISTESKSCLQLDINLTQAKLYALEQFRPQEFTWRNRLPEGC